MAGGHMSRIGESILILYIYFLVGVLLKRDLDLLAEVTTKIHQGHSYTDEDKRRRKTRKTSNSRKTCRYAKFGEGREKRGVSIERT